MAILSLIKHPLVSEKATDLHAKGSYVFMVEKNATKNEIKKAIKEIYKADVARVNMVRIQKRTRKFRNIVSPGLIIKKAIVTLKKGQTIDLG